MILRRKKVKKQRNISEKKGFIKDGKKTIKKYRNNLLRNNLSSYKKIFRYLYFKVFSEIYCSTAWFTFKEQFSHYFQNIQGQKSLEISLGKNPENYKTIRNEASVFEQKPINKVDDFNKIGEKEVKERAEK